MKRLLTLFAALSVSLFIGISAYAGLENPTFINDLVPTNPVGATDPVSEGALHIQRLKTVLQNSFSNATGPLIPAGVVFDYAGAGAIPVGWQLCDGSAISRAANAALFTAIGTTWGAGDGATTFNVPDFRRRVSMGSGGTALFGPANTVGSSGGDENMAQHNHTATSTVTDPGHIHSGGQQALPQQGATGGSSFLTAAALANTGSAVTGVTVSTSIANAGTGTGGNVQPSLVVQKIIKL